MTKISVASYDGALTSTVWGVKELVEMAAGAMLMLGKSADLSAEVLDMNHNWELSPKDVGDIVFLPPVFAGPDQIDEMVEQRAHVVAWLKSLKRTKHVICGCCTAVSLMAAAGLLNGKKATTTWWLLRPLAERFPKVAIQENDMLVEDGRFITSAGPYSFIPQTLNLIERYVGVEASRLCAKVAVVEPGRPLNGIYAVPSLFSEHDPFLTRAQEVITRGLSTGLTVGTLAHGLGVSERTLHRRLTEKSGLSPRQMISNTRIEVAKTILETSNEPIARVSAAVGFEDDSSFRAAFAKAVGITPTAYRTRMNPRN